MKKSIIILVMVFFYFPVTGISSSVEDIYNEKHQKIYGQLMTLRYNELIADSMLKLSQEFNYQHEIEKDTNKLYMVRENIKKTENEFIDVKLDAAKYYKGHIPKSLMQKFQEREDKYNAFMKKEYVELLEENTRKAKNQNVKK